MPRNHKPSKVSQVLTQRSSKYSVSGDGHHCPKSLTGAHWWQIESPYGETSMGMCRYCGEQRKFSNTLEASFSLESER